MVFSKLMKDMLGSITIMGSLFFCLGCTPVSVIQETNPVPLSFPGAEGFGKYTAGGRGGKVYLVNNLEDDGEGSLRQALNRSGSKIIVFNVSGTIHLKSPMNIKANTTIAGQTAPGDGICIADQPVKIDGDNVIIRYMRFRMGDRYQNTGKIHGAGSDDALSANRKKNIIIDHCSISWSTDEVLSVYAGDSTTIQWSIISEPLNYSYHFEKGGDDFQHHGYGGIIGGRHISIHHNLYAHCQSRTPRFDGIRNLKNDVELADFTNNVIYNWGGNNVYGGEGGNYNIVNNYYKSGPNTKKSVMYRVANPFKRENEIPFGKYFIDGNFVHGSPGVTNDNWKGVVMDKGTDVDVALSKMENPHPVISVGLQKSMDAYNAVMNDAGASFRRDTLDQRIINDVKNATGRIIDVQGGFPHGTSYEQTKHAWPVLRSSSPLADADQDGMPDEWEKRNDLNPADASDASGYHLNKYYTNVEVYVNSLIKTKDF